MPGMPSSVLTPLCAWWLPAPQSCTYRVTCVLKGGASTATTAPRRLIATCLKRVVWQEVPGELQIECSSTEQGRTIQVNPSRIQAFGLANRGEVPFRSAAVGRTTGQNGPRDVFLSLCQRALPWARDARRPPESRLESASRGPKAGKKKENPFSRSPFVTMRSESPRPSPICPGLERQDHPNKEEQPCQQRTQK
jgi:hypothetical protein